MGSVEEELWLCKNTRECPLGRLTPKMCESLRSRPTTPDDYTKLMKPEACVKCTLWMEPMTAKETRICDVCDKELPLTAEHFERTGKTTFRRTCRACRRSGRYNRRLSVETVDQIDPMLDAVLGQLRYSIKDIATRAYNNGRAVGIGEMRTKLKKLVQTSISIEGEDETTPIESEPERTP